MRIFKTTSRSSVATFPFSVIDIAGSPGPGTLAGSSAAAGVVPTDATAGIPTINAFTGGATGYVTRAEFSSPIACRLAVFDLLFKAGSYTFNTDTSLSDQPSYASRIPGGDYKGTEIWLETITQFTGNQSIQINYLDQDGDAGDTGVVATGIQPGIGRMYRVPLATGDGGVSRIDRVRSTVSAAGTFNVLVMRKLVDARVRLANDQVVQGFDLTGMPQVFEDSALMLVVYPDAAATSFPEVLIDIANG